MRLSILITKMSCKTFELLLGTSHPRNSSGRNVHEVNCKVYVRGVGTVGEMYMEDKLKQSQRYHSNAEKCVSQALNSDVKFCMILLGISIQQCLQCRMQLMKSRCQVNQIAIVTTVLRIFTLLKFHLCTDFRSRIVHFNIKELQIETRNMKTGKDAS
jgi:hypothetical protein